MEIEVNGIKYISKEQPKMHISKTLMMIMIMAGMTFGDKENRQKAIEIDIVKEYGLIEQKKSNLSKSQRDWVIQEFKKNFQRIPF